MMNRRVFYISRIFAAAYVLIIAAPVLGSDYTLGIFGNANMDSTIDEKDIAYVEEVIKGAKAPTNLSDANGDGTVDQKDSDQIKRILQGNEDLLIILDGINRTVKIAMPVKGIVPLVDRDAKVLAVLGAQDKTVAVADDIKKNKEHSVVLPKFSELPSVGSYSDPDLEKLIELKPDVVLAHSVNAEDIAKSLGDQVLVLGFPPSTPESIVDELLKLGYVLNREENSRVYMNEFRDKYLNIIQERTKDLPETERPRVYVENSNGPYQTSSKSSVVQRLVELAGGRHIFSDLEGGAHATVSAEDVLKRNPDIIVKYASKDDSGYGINDSAKMDALYKEIMSRSELADVSAIKNGQVHVMSSYLSYGTDFPVLLMYWSKWLHPSLFEDIDPEEVHREYLKMFFGKDYAPGKQGAFVWPIK
jgi:iron complex transport system substrate-binding protein